MKNGEALREMLLQRSRAEIDTIMQALDIELLRQEHPDRDPRHVVVDCIIYSLKHRHNLHGVPYPTTPEGLRETSVYKLATTLHYANSAKFAAEELNRKGIPGKALNAYLFTHPLAGLPWKPKFERAAPRKKCAPVPDQTPKLLETIKTLVEHCGTLEERIKALETQGRPTTEHSFPTRIVVKCPAGLTREEAQEQLLQMEVNYNGLPHLYRIHIQAWECEEVG